MVSLARVVTVDPTGAIAQIVRAAVDLTAHPIIQIDVPGSAEARAEIEGKACRLLITELNLHDGMDGISLALAVKQASPDTGIIVLAAPEDPAELDDDFRREAPFVYLHRPLDPAQFMRFFKAGLEGSDLAAAYVPVVQPAAEIVQTDLGPIPPLDVKAAARVIDTLLTDIGAMAIVLANRAGDVVLERGAVGYLDREALTLALLPTTKTTFDMGQLIGGQPSALHFYDGETFDVFVLSVGFHHFMCLIFDGQVGSRQFGAVNRFGRRGAEDLVAILGMSAFAFTAPAAEEEEPLDTESEQIAEMPEPLIERAEEWTTLEPELLPEPEPIHFDPIENLDLSLFDNLALDNLDESAADDLFDPEKLAEIANETRRERGPLSYDEARELGIIP